jgi:hypothetical protein
MPESEELETILASCWHELDQNHAGGMVAEKLYDRIEEVLPEPPLLTFTIERHGGTVRGSLGPSFSTGP